MFLQLSIGLFLLFIVNLLFGTFGGEAFLSSIGEMLLLLATSIIFVIALLREEAIAKLQTTKEKDYE